MDINVQNHTSIYLVSADTPQGNNWLDDNVGGEITTLGDAIVVEHSYINDLVGGMLTDGLKVAVDGNEVELA